MGVDLITFMGGILLFIITTYWLVRVRRYYYLANSHSKKAIIGLAVTLTLLGLLGGTVIILTAFGRNVLRPMLELITIGMFLLLSLLSLRCLEREICEIYVRKEEGGSGIKKSDVFLVESTEEAKLLLKALHREKVPILVISRRTWEEWVREFGIEPERFLWLSGVSHRHAVSPSSLHILREEAVKFMRNHEKSAIYIEGIEYLMFYSEFSAIAKFLFTLKDYAVVSGAYMIVLAIPQILDEKQFNILAREFKRPNIKEIEELLSSKAFFGTLLREDLDKLAKRTNVKSREQEGENNASNKSAEGESGASKEETEKA
ncbi:DUF835 domain-containing protein [Thermococcus sp. GR6]|uniref:DUF835 domain-containing protein n=1 Tax=Thermococcus sp. GR6 TaxID=1638256 RepID=UPI001430FFDC|nr:DUF835 domain-containing protein [Thermococcus sp. GR6]NJE43323.1 DUF835 domain-containing protein [Thermococcus sp. GR6]